MDFFYCSIRYNFLIYLWPTNYFSEQQCWKDGKLPYGCCTAHSEDTLYLQSAFYSYALEAPCLHPPSFQTSHIFVWHGATGNAEWSTGHLITIIFLHCLETANRNSQWVLLLFLSLSAQKTETELLIFFNEKSNWQTWCFSTRKSVIMPVNYKLKKWRENKAHSKANFTLFNKVLFSTMSENWSTDQKCIQ